MKQNFLSDHDKKTGHTKTYAKNFKGIGARKGMKGARAGSVRARLVFFGVLAVLLLLGSVFSEALAPYDPNLQDLANAKAAPSAAHLLGTDRYGRDMLSRVIAGSRASISRLCSW